MTGDALPLKNTLSTGVVIGATLLTCLALTWLRMRYVQSPAEWLYVEDSSVFLATANYDGLLTLFVAYAGYYHLVVRIVALIITLFDITVQPLATIALVLLLHCIIWTLIAVTLLSLDVSKPVVFLVCILLVIQPTHQELMPNLTNTQWWTGMAMMVFVLGYQGRVSVPVAVFVGFVCGLQGPFSILLLPVLVAQRLMTKDGRNKKLVICVGFAALIQCFSVSMNARGGFAIIDNEVVFSDAPIMITTSFFQSILAALKDGFVYNPEDPFGVAFIAACLLLALYGVARAFRGGKDNPSRRNAQVFLAFIAVALVAGLSTVFSFIKEADSGFLSCLNCVVQNNRYLFIPHCLLIIGLSVLLYRCPRLSFAVAAGFVYVSVVNYSFADRFPTYFASYVNMGRFMETDALMNPSGHEHGESFFWNVWVYPFRQSAYEPLAENRVIALLPPKPDSSSMIRLTTDVSCPDSSDIALRVNMFSPGPVKVDVEAVNGLHAYSAHRLYDTTVTTLFYYNGVSSIRPKGDIVMDFAFPYPGERTVLDFSLQPYHRAQGEAGVSSEGSDAGVKELTVRDMTLFCLPTRQSRVFSDHFLNGERL